MLYKNSKWEVKSTLRNQAIFGGWGRNVMDIDRALKKAGKVLSGFIIDC